eukprot:49307-Alexandrium_andersonii.AAC.1
MVTGAWASPGRGTFCAALGRPGRGQEHVYAEAHVVKLAILFTNSERAQAAEYSTPDLKLAVPVLHDTATFIRILDKAG